MSSYNNKEHPTLKSRASHRLQSAMKGAGGGNF